MVNTVTSYISRSGKGFKTMPEAEADEANYLGALVDGGEVALKSIGIDPENVWRNREIVQKYIDNKTAYRYLMGDRD